MFVKLKDLLASCQSISLFVTAEGEVMTVTVIPKPKCESEAALKTPLNLVGTAAELEAGFVEAIGTYAQAHTSLADQVAQTAKLLESAKTQSAAKAVKQAVKAEPKPVSIDDLTPDEGPQDEKPSDDSDKEQEPVKAPAAQPAAALDLGALL